MIQPLSMTPAKRRELAKRREALAERMRELAVDADHWNRTHPNEEPIVLDFNLEKDVLERIDRALKDAAESEPLSYEPEPEDVE